MLAKWQAPIASVLLSELAKFSSHIYISVYGMYGIRCCVSPSRWG